MSSSPLGLIAGGGALPLQLARDLRTQGRPFQIIGIEGAGDDALNDYDCIWNGVGALKRAADILHEKGCQEIFFLGGLTHPNFEAVTPDEGGLWLLEEWLKSGASGDDMILRLLLRYFEEQGFTIAAPLTLLASLLGGVGVQGAHQPSEGQLQDASIAMTAALAIGGLDIGQGAIACRKRIIAVEGAEGTDGLLRRVQDLPEAARGTDAQAAGVLAKATKPTQDLRIDLPTIGVQTVQLAAAAHLEMIAYQAGYTLCDNLPEMIAQADKANIILYGIEKTGGDK